MGERGVSFVAAFVDRSTTITERYAAHAAHQSMSGYLDDWEQAHALLGRQIEVLRRLRDERRTAAEAGKWPGPTTAVDGGAP